jgi:hypothetical protein
LNKLNKDLPNTHSQTMYVKRLRIIRCALVEQTEPCAHLYSLLFTRIIGITQPPIPLAITLMTFDFNSDGRAFSSSLLRTSQRQRTAGLSLQVLRLQPRNREKVAATGCFVYSPLLSAESPALSLCRVCVCVCVCVGRERKAPVPQEFFVLSRLVSW